MQLSDWLSPLSSSIKTLHTIEGSIGEHIKIYGVDFEDYLPDDTQVAIVGIAEDRCTHGGEALAVDGIREALYDLANPLSGQVIVDLGLLKNGKTLKDTYYAVDALTSFLRERNVITVIVGGSTDITYGTLLPVVRGERFLHWTSIHPHVFPENYHHTELDSPLSQLLWTPNDDLEYTQVGYQTYLCSVARLSHIQQYYDAFRLGVVRSNMEAVEPYFRDSHIVSLSMTAVRYADAPQTSLLSPNGFMGEDVCQLSFFAGTSTHCDIFGVYDVVQSQKVRIHVTDCLAAQAIHHFLQGVQMRVNENPLLQPEGFQKYMVSLDKVDQVLYFQKSLRTGRWWLELAHPDGAPMVTACSQLDYEKACNNDIPDRWCKLIQR